MSTKPNIVISSLDADRLDTLLDSLSATAFPGITELLAELERAEWWSRRRYPRQS